MKKKTLKTISVLLGAVSAAFALTAVFLIFADAVSTTVLKKDYTYTGAQVVFGYALGTGALKTWVFHFNILAFIAYFLPLAGGALAFFAKSKGMCAAAFLCFVVSAVLLFLMPELSTLFIGDQLTGDSEALVFALNVGAILAGVFSALGGILAIAKNFFLPANKK